MALISAKTILTSLSLFHIMLGYFFLANPMAVADQHIVWILGESMGMPYERSFEAQSPPLAFLAVLLATIGITDLVTLSLPDEIGLFQHWGAQAPLRFLISILLLTYAFVFSPASPIYAHTSTARRFTAHPSAHAPNPPGYVPAGWGGDGLKNRVFFAFAFVELVSWLWVWVTLREERREWELRRAKRRGSQSYR